MPSIKSVAKVRTVPAVPVVAKPKPWPRVNPDPVLAEARKRNKVARTTSRAKSIRDKLLSKPTDTVAQKTKPDDVLARVKEITKGRRKRRGKRGGLRGPDTIVRTGVSSSNIASIGYDLPSRVLEVEFNDGAVYRYYDVDPSVHKSFMRASSKGRFLWKYIRGLGSDTVYVYSRVE